MLMPAPTEAARPTRKASQLLVGSEGRGEDRGQRRDRAIHEAGQTGLHDLEHEQAAAGGVLVALGLGRQLLRLQLAGAMLVGALRLGQVVEQLADMDILERAEARS